MAVHQGFSHVSLSVTDREASSKFYAQLLGFEEFERISDPLYDEIVMVHRNSGTLLCLQQHHTNGGESAHPARTGADHVAFRVATRAELDEWVQLLGQLDVTHSPIADREYGSVLCLRDPDQIQLELFFKADHP